MAELAFELHAHANACKPSTDDDNFVFARIHAGGFMVAL
jgi:hypothetical protein